MKNLDIKKILEKLSLQTEKKILLWENPNPTSSFITQTIDSTKSGWVGPSDLSEFSYVEIEFGRDNNKSALISKGQIGKEITAINWSDTSDTYILTSAARVYTTSTSGIVFQDAYTKGVSSSTTPTKNNNRLIPTKIYGIKLGGGATLISKIASLLLKKRGGEQ